MALWPTTLRIGGEELRLLVMSPHGDDLLKARLPVRTPHPRAPAAGSSVLATFAKCAATRAWSGPNEAR